jgi:hypothetical protein
MIPEDWDARLVSGITVLGMITEPRQGRATPTLFRDLARANDHGNGTG